MDDPIDYLPRAGIFALTADAGALAPAVLAPVFLPPLGAALTGFAGRLVRFP